MHGPLCSAAGGSSADLRDAGLMAAPRRLLGLPTSLPSPSIRRARPALPLPCCDANGMRVTRLNSIRPGQWVCARRHVAAVPRLSFLCRWEHRCSLDQAAGGTNAGLCPAYARPDMFQREQHVYVADSGNCRIALVDYSDGAVATKWGARGCANSSADFKDEEPVADRVVLGSRLSVAWVGYEFLLVVDGEANRLRKFVTSQHQGLSTLVGNGTCGGADGEGETATLCNPVHAAVTPDLKRLVVAERLDGAGASESFNRLRIVDLAFSYLDGGDLEDVNATVRTLLYEPIEVRVPLEC